MSPAASSPPRGFPCRAVDRRPDRARRDRVDADFFARQLLGHRLHQQLQPALRRRVVRVPGPRDALMHRIGEQDLAQRDASVTGRCPGVRNWRTASCAHRNWPVRLTSITRCHCSSVISVNARIALDACIGDQDIDAAELPVAAANRRAALFGLGNIGADREARGRRFRQCARPGVRPRLSLMVIDHHGGTRFCKRQRDALRRYPSFRR